jgi:hypothetical protein
MSKGRDRTVYKREDQWVQKRNDAARIGGVYNTQAKAVDAATRMLSAEGGGELTIKGRDGRIRSKDTIAPGNDPFPPRDREH